MSSNVFRSHLMQQFVATATRTHQRTSTGASVSVPLRSTSRFHTKSQHVNNNLDSPNKNNAVAPSSTAFKDDNVKKDSSGVASQGFRNDISYNNQNDSHTIPSSSMAGPLHLNNTAFQKRIFATLSKYDNEESNNLKSASPALSSSQSLSLQTLLKTRRTTSNFVPLNNLSEVQQQNIHYAMYRSIECGVQAPNHYRTEATTYYRIKPYTSSWEKLLDIVYNVTLVRAAKAAAAYTTSSNSTTKKQTIKEILFSDEMKMKAESKRSKWQDSVGGYIVVCVSGQPSQDQIEVCVGGEEMSDNNDNIDDGNNVINGMMYQYETLPTYPPQTVTQMEDYASACASIQNILLSLHAEGLGAKWATGPIPNCRALRELVGCEIHDLVAGLVMVGVPRKSHSKELRKHRDFVGDVLKDL